MSGNHLIVERRDSVLQLTINRPDKRNALSLALLDDIRRTLADNCADPAIKGAVITGVGDKCFAAGGDLQEFDAIRSVPDTLAMSRLGRRALQQVREFPVPVVAALNGHALGGGAELALACDLRIAAAHAEIGFLQSRLEVTTAWGGGIDLAATVGDRRALALLATGRRLSAMAALQAGVVDQVQQPGENFDGCVRGFLADYLSPGRQVLIGIKVLASAGRRRLHAQLAAIEEQHFVMTWTHAEHWDAVAGATSGRKPGGPASSGDH